MKKILLLPLILFLTVSCNGLRKDVASKDGVKLFEGQSHPNGYKLKSYPQSVTLFLWPTEEEYNRLKASGQTDRPDYQKYIADVARNVFFFGDKFDEVSLERMDKKAEIDAERPALEEEIDKAKDAYKEANKKRRALKKQYKEECVDTPDTEECQKLEADVDQAEQDYKELKTVYNELKDKRDNEDAELGDLTVKISKNIFRVQASLDPAAVVYVMDGEDRMMDPYTNLPMIENVEPEKQINYFNNNKDKSVFEIKGGYIYILFSDLGPNKIEYKTIFKKNDLGEVVLGRDGSPVMLPESDFSRMILVGRNVYEFDMLEKDVNGNRTGRTFEFTIETSPFGKHMKALGDVNVTYNGEIVRRGQAKFIIGKDD